MRPHGSAAELEARRRRAAACFQAGESVRTVAERFGVDRSSAKRWRRAWREEGPDGFAAKPHPGGKRKLSDAQRDELVDSLIAGSRAAGFPTDLWTCARVVELIRDRFGVEYDSGQIARVLRQLGFTPQKPRTVAREQDPEAVEHGVGTSGADQKKTAAGCQHRLPRRNGLPAAAAEPADLGPRGCTPVPRSWDRRDRLSAIGAVVLSPARTQSGCCFDVQRKNVKTDNVIDFLRRLRRKVRRPLIVVWDRWSVHRSAERRITQRGWKRIESEYLPAYRPELNPVEAMWSHAKYADLANFVPDDIDELNTAVHASLDDQATDHRLKLSFFKTAQLRL
ncbi:hypothetical protein Pla108_04140 [Botrimarina colliarenosi]|uniref:IS630 family transposase n=1 Tax=Botrimarina colliarenosi TaxID=2528001 RepID=A0A5C6AJY1_9BACT|nr:IS630 family transposase [Botrimarina colliarenosi]TWT99475.1 hypothetical protein Pla108_04140 [Botrimarina colliarenosi]